MKCSSLPRLLHVMFVSFIIEYSQVFGSFSNSSLTPLCRPEERAVLLRLKASFSIHVTPSTMDFPCGNRSYAKTFSWRESSKNCCEWDGITCDAATRYVVGLNLSCSWLKGVISSNSSLFSLRHLQNLILSGNDFRGSSVSPEFGHFKNLTHLDLSRCNFSGNIPPEIARLSRLSFFALITYPADEKISIGASTFIALARNLTRLAHLSLTRVDMSTVSLASMANLSSSMTSLSLINCGLHGKLPESFLHFPEIQDLSLGGNNLYGEFPWSSLEFEHLNSLELTNNNFTGRIPELYDNPLQNSTVFPTNLMVLDLSNNSFEGRVPSWIFKPPFLLVLSLANNRFIGELDEFYSSWLNILALEENKLHGPIPSFIFQNVNLIRLDMSSNNFSGDFYLEKLSKLRDLSYLSLSSNSLSVTFKSSTNLSLDNLLYLGLSSCNIVEFPNFLKWSKSLEVLDLSRNQIHGSIPSAFCDMTSLSVLHLSRNNLSGEIPPCITSFSDSLSVLDLQMNNLHGSFPSVFAEGNSLRTLNLKGNELKGSLHKSLLNCKKLEVFDIGDNNITGPFPKWLESLPELQVLILRGNKFYGPIGSPTARFSFRKLRVFDISNNEITGPLPRKYFENLAAMTEARRDELEYIGDRYYSDSVTVVMKDHKIQLEKILTIFRAIDLSRNYFEGDIPSSIGKLKSLKGLNFSHNKLVGVIPISLANLSNLEWLDLSSNMLHGEIPEKLAEDLTQLSSLNLSHNNLAGHIPRGKQFNTFENDSFIGNLGLCGLPLSKTCGNGEAQQSSPMGSKHGEEIFDWNIVALMGYGCGMVFGASMGYVTIPDTTIHRIMNIKTPKKNVPRVRRVVRGRN